MFGMFRMIQLIHLTRIIHLFSRNHTNVTIFPKLRNNDVTYILIDCQPDDEKYSAAM